MGEGWLDMAQYTPVALDEDGERELRKLKALSSFIFYFDDCCLVTSSRVIVDPSSCRVTPMTTNNQLVVVCRLVAMSLWATWNLGCVCDYRNGREAIA